MYLRSSCVYVLILRWLLDNRNSQALGTDWYMGVATVWQYTLFYTRFYRTVSLAEVNVPPVSVSAHDYCSPCVPIC